MNRATMVSGFLFMLLCLGCSAQAANVKGGITFPLSQRAPMPVSVTGNLMTMDGKMWSGPGGLGGGQRVRFEAKVRNNSSGTAFYSIQVAFFDKAWNLIAAHGSTQIFGQGPGKTDSMAADLSMPQSELSKIAAFQVTFYDDTVNIGKR